MNTRIVTPPSTPSDLELANYQLKLCEFELKQQEFSQKQDEHHRTKWQTWLSLIVTALVGVAATVVTVSQYKLAVNDDHRKTLEMSFHNNEDLRRATDLRLKDEAAYNLLTATWFKAVQDNEEKINSPDPAIRCRYKQLLKTLVSDSFFQGHYGALGIQTSFCDDSRLLALAIQAKQDGAPEGWLRRDAANNILSINCTAVRTENLHGTNNPIRHGTCKLPDSVPANARIYDATYACAEYACGWSYNRNGGYGIDIDAINPSDNPRQIVWHRRWDGDAVTESYKLFYEVPRT